MRRHLLVTSGLLLLVLNHRGGEDTFLGFYSLNDSRMVGYNLATLAIALLGIWLIRRALTSPAS